ncbi:MAG: MFS transporter [Lachnospiraceae bacterium]|nr:MFS transporter [Lachnospiraceae bacterium]
MRSNTFLKKAALLCCGYGLMSDAVIVPLTTSILKDFPGTGEVLINFIIGGSFLFSLLSALVTGRVIHRFNKKNVLLFGTLVYSIASFSSAFAPNIAFLAVTRAIDGLTDGMVGVAVVLAINEMFEDPQERNTMVGLHWTAVSAYGVVLSLLSGFLCVCSWRTSLFSNILSFITPLLIWVCVPSMPPRKGDAVHAEICALKEIKKDKLPWLWIGFSLLASLVLNCLSNVFYFTADFYVTERSLGNSALTGAFTAMSTVGGAAGIVFGKLYGKLRNGFPVMLFAAAAIGTAALALPIGAFWICIFHILIGATYTLGLSYYQASVVERIHSSKNGQILSFFDVVSYIGLSSSAYVPMAIALFTGRESYVTCYIPISIVLLIFAGIYLVYMVSEGRKTALRK